MFSILTSNAPATRRQKIFESLSNSNAQVIFNEVHRNYILVSLLYTLRHLRNNILQIECREDNLDLALVAHDKGFINFLDTSWSRWEAMENHCVHFFGWINYIIPYKYFTRYELCQMNHLYDIEIYTLHICFY